MEAGRSEVNLLILARSGALTEALLEMAGGLSGRVTLLLEGSESERARIQEENPWLRVEAGLPTSIDFGLSGERYLSLCSEITHVIAAFRPESSERGDLEKATAVSVVRELREFARARASHAESRGLLQLTWLSHLLIFGSRIAKGGAGDGPTLVFERDLGIGQQFYGGGDEAHAVAERMLRGLRGAAQVRILRTGALLGDASRGIVIADSVLPELLQRMEFSPRALEVRYTDTPVHFEFVESVVAALERATFDGPPDPVATLHLVHDNAPTDRALLEWLGERTGREIRESDRGQRSRRFPSPLENLHHIEGVLFSGCKLSFDKQVSRRTMAHLLERSWQEKLGRLLDVALGLEPSRPYAVAPPKES